MSLLTEIVADLVTIESDLGSPVFTYSSSNYNFIPSISEFKRELDTGGYKIIKLLTATVRKLDTSGNNIFTVYPTAQQTFVYSMDSTKYRIESVKHDPTGAYFRMIATSDTRGI